MSASCVPTRSSSTAVALEAPEVQAARRGRVHLERAAPGARAVGSLTLLGAPRSGAQRVQLEARDLGRAAGRDVHAGVEHAVQRHALQLAQRVEEVGPDDHAAQRIARALGRAVQLHVRDAEPGQERARVAQRLAAQQRRRGRWRPRACCAGRPRGARARRRSSRSSSASRSRSARAASASASACSRRSRTSLSSVALRSSSLAERCAATSSAGQEDRAVGVEPQRPRALGARRGVGERDDDAPVGDVQAHDARGEHVVALGLELRGAVRQRHERVGARQQLHLEAVVAAPPHAHAHDVARACLLGDRRDLVGLERLQIEPRRAVGRELAHARAHALADAQHVVAGVHEPAREVARAHACAAVGECERRRARVERDDLALDVVADREAVVRARVLDPERRQQGALGLALASLERVDARMQGGAVREREPRVVDAGGATPDGELVAQHVAQRVGGLARLDQHDLRAAAQPPRQRARLDQRAPVTGRDHDLGQLALRRQQPEVDVLAHLLRWKPHVELVRGPCRHIGSMAGRRTGYNGERSLPPARQHAVQRLEQPVGVALRRTRAAA